MKNMKTKSLRVVIALLIACLFCGGPLTAYAAQMGGDEIGVEVTRLEWLQALTSTFQMSVEEDNYPDNYYSDIDASSENYYDIMLATEFGLVDVEAGGELRPDEAATREFVAHTMNLCMGYQLENEKYTFSEAGSVSYPEDIQISIDKGWLELVDGKFLPEQGITVAEKNKMITAAEAAVASTTIDPDYNNQYKLAEGVVEIPEETAVVLTDVDELTLYNCDIALSEGTVFVVVSEGIPIARRALSVTVTDDKTVVKVEGVEVEEAFESLDVQGTIAADLTQTQAVDDGVTLAYIVGGTKEQAYEDGITLYSLDEVEQQDQAVTAVIASKKIEIPSNGVSFYGLEADPGKESITLNCKITEVSVDYGASLLDLNAYMKVTGKVTFSCNIGLADFEIPNLENPFVKVPIGVVGYFEPVAEGKVSGSVSLCLKGNLSVGVQWDHGAVRGVFEFKKAAFTIQAKAEVTLGVKAAIGVDVVFMKAELYAKAGVKAYIGITSYTDSKLPERCTHMAAHLYAAGGGSVSFKVFGYKSTVSLEKDIFNEKNSPVKVALHYEDGEPVSSCTRDGAGGSDSGDSGSNGSESGSSGSGSAKKYKYYTPIDSQYAYSGANTGISSTGETYTIFEYSLNEDNQATITKYNGNVSALNIPETIDGHTVVGIGAGVFKNNTRLMLVNIPDTVAKIGNYAFENCSNLADVSLSKSLKSIGYEAFYNCDALTGIEIPKSLEEAGYRVNFKGAFADCDNLKSVTFETGTTEIAKYLFWGCTGLEEIIIPDTVTVIEEGAFEGCKNLRKVTISASATSIESSAFSDCKMLSEVLIPNSVTKIGNYAFENCSNLADVTLSKSLVSMGYEAFYNCDALTGIEIPKSLEEAGYRVNFKGVFADCDNLKSVTFETGTTEIAKYLFWGCTGLEEIIIPDTVTVIEEGAFEGCKNLRKVTISASATSIESSAFSDCKMLSEVLIPNSVTKIGNDAFANCSNLADVSLSKSLKSIGYEAFYNCDALTGIEIPKSLEEAGYRVNFKGAFADCDNLKSVTFETGTTEIAKYLFWGCTGLEEIVIPDTVTVLENDAFRDCTNLQKVSMSASATSIESSAFRGCFSLLEMTIPDTVTSMGTYVFAECTSLRSVKLPNIRQNVSEGTFQNCTSLTEIELPDSVTAIRKNAFQNCSSLTEVKLPNSVTIIEQNAFQNSGLKEAVLSTGLTSIDSYAFNNCDALMSITIPDSVTSLGTYCFADCEVLSEVKLGSGLTQINSYTFNLCPSLQKVVLPYRMSTVAANAFTNCTNLTELVVPRATCSIASDAFSYPTKMTVYGVAGTYAEEWANSVKAIFVNQEKPAETVSLNETAVTINNGKTFKLVLSVTPADFTDAISWKSNNESVATVSDTGVITAKGVGSATIRVTVGSVSANCKVTVVQPVTSISLNKTSLSMEAEAVYALSASVSPSNANDKTVTWSSSDDTVASVDQDGKVTAHKKGTAVITVTANDGSGISKSCTVNVTNSCYYCTDVSELESAHNYENNCKDIWVYTLSGAERIAVTFDTRTCIEDEFDYLYLYDSAGSQVGMYTGVSLAGQTIIIDGDTVKIKLNSDSSGNEWGFKVTKVEEYCEHTFADVWSSDENYHWHAATCGHTDVMKDKEKHTSGEWIVDKEATEEEKGSRHRECLTCHRVLETEEMQFVGPVVLTVKADKSVANPGDTVNFQVSIGAVEGLGGLDFCLVLPEGLTFVEESVEIPEGVFDALGASENDTVKLSGTDKRWNHTAQENGYTGTSELVFVKFSCIVDEDVAFEEKSVALKVDTCFDMTEDRKELKTSVNPVKVTVEKKKNELTITSQPTGASVFDGEQATFSIAATGDGLTYQWQLCYAGDDTFKKCTFPGADTSTLTVDATRARNGYRFRCVVTNELGESLTSDAAVLTVSTRDLGVSLVASQSTADPGDKVTFTAQGNGGDGNYQYKFIINDTANDKWYKLQDFSSNNTIEWTATTAGTKRIMVDIRDGSGKSVGKNVSVVVNGIPELSAKFTASAYEVNSGDTVTLTAVAMGGSGKYNYKFIINDKTNDKWYRLQDFGSNNVITWKATTSGTKRLMVDVVDSQGRKFGTNITITVK